MCSYTTKVRNIEEAGGHVAIIVNNKDEKVEEMFLADDGLGGDISIPAILISKTDGDKIIQYYLMHKDNKKDINKIRFEIKFDIENKNNIVNYDIWYTPDLVNVYTFFKDFAKYQEVLGEYAHMEVHFVTYPHFLYKPDSNSPKDDCLGSGLYCIRPGKIGIADGRLVVMESIKQKCIYNYAIKNNKIDSFWNYMVNFYEECVQKEEFTQVCSNRAISIADINLNEINDCIYESFIGTSFEKQQKDYQYIMKNNILDKEYELRKTYAINRVPSITINKRLYIGSWRPEFIFEALCAGLLKKPKACYVEGSFLSGIRGFSFIGTCLIIIVVLFINIVLFITCKMYIEKIVNKRISSKDINSKIDSAINSYIQLK
jgi:hypothetical protein